VLKYEKRKNANIIKYKIGDIEIEKMIIVKPQLMSRRKGDKLYTYNRIDVVVDHGSEYYVLPYDVYYKLLKIYDRYEAVRSVAQKLCERFAIEIETRITMLKGLLEDRYRQKEWIEKHKNEYPYPEREIEALEFGIKVITTDMQFYTQTLENIKRLCKDYVYSDPFED